MLLPGRGCFCLIMMYVGRLSSFVFRIPSCCCFSKGTLAPIVKIPSMAIPSAAALEALEELSNDPKNVVYIISGRDQEFLDLHLGHLKNIGFSAEHGGFVKAAGSGEWRNYTENLDMSWIPEVEKIFRYYTEVRFVFFFPLGKWVLGILIFWFVGDVEDSGKSC